MHTEQPGRVEPCAPAVSTSTSSSARRPRTSSCARHSTRARAQRGLSVVELVVVLAILTVAMGMFAQTLASSARLDPMSSETAIAADAARVQIEQMRNRPFDDVFALFNTDPADDPDGAGTAPGSTFNVVGLAPVAAEGSVGTIDFPAVGGDLREDVVDEMLGMPRDLNGDALVDTGDHSADRIILPVRIRIEWATRSGKGGKRSFVMYTMLADL